MKQDQWARLYEEERQLRIEAEEATDFYAQVAGDILFETISLIDYIDCGHTPLIIHWNDYEMNYYLIS
jgi:hypothetical protein